MTSYPIRSASLLVGYALILSAVLLAALGHRAAQGQAPPIDRQALVTRHNVVHRSADAKHFLQVGNGEFAYSFDVTGMQTLDRAFKHPIPLHTMSNWGWHSFPNTGDYKYEQTLSEFDVQGRKVSYADRQDTKAGAYFRANPHRFNLARIGLWWEGQDEAGATAADFADFTEIEQTLDLWTGVATSKFKFRSEPVTVTTVAHPTRDAAAFRIESQLVASGTLGLSIKFSSSLGVWGPAVDDFTKPTAHQTAGGIAPEIGSAAYQRTLDDFQYKVMVEATSPIKFVGRTSHSGHFKWPRSQIAEIAIEFAAGKFPAIDPSDRSALEAMAAEASNRLHYSDVIAASTSHWKQFWSTGGALDLSGTDDPRAAEIERRVVLSQYLTAIQNGSLPPQETGLATNSWFGKQHLEMHWWHTAHFALWGRPEILEKSLAWYQQILPQARRIAERQGYKGVRWPKMSGPDGVSSPSGVGEFLAWQQPHFIALTELVSRATADPPQQKQILERYGEAVHETAVFMADYVQWDADGKTCHLGAPLIPAQENYKPRVTSDPTYELAYWHWALSVAQQWRERNGQPRDAGWDRVIAGLARPLVRDGRYAAVAVEPFTNTADHPSMLCAYGVLPQTPLIDPAVMRATAEWVEDDANWNWKSTWGWDFPVVAMTFARCGDPARAVNALLRDTPKNTYLPNGHNYQEERLPLYLPGNGGTLAATALMAAGWEGGPKRSAPGFPADWTVRYENLRPSP
jgi:protein-glucosylgalactosylhydroxylysine glucosidase